MMIKKILLVLFVSTCFSLSAEEIFVKYRGMVDVDNGHFTQLSLKPSSFINNMYFDSDNKYLLVQLNTTYYHYCSIPSQTINGWLNSPSLGRYYNKNVKGNFDCRINPIPQY